MTVSHAVSLFPGLPAVAARLFRPWIRRQKFLLQDLAGMDWWILSHAVTATPNIAMLFASNRLISASITASGSGGW